MTPPTPAEALAAALGEIIESRMSRDLAWTQDDGKTIIRLNPEDAGWHLGHLLNGRLAASGWQVTRRDEGPVTDPLIHVGGTDMDAIDAIEREIETVYDEGQLTMEGRMRLDDAIEQARAALASPEEAGK